MTLFIIFITMLMLFFVGWNHYATKRFQKRYRAHYSDGEVSRPMNYYLAKNYAEIFGGKVVKDESLDPYGFSKE